MAVGVGRRWYEGGQSLWVLHRRHVEPPRCVSLTAGVSVHVRVDCTPRAMRASVVLLAVALLCPAHVNGEP